MSLPRLLLVDDHAVVAEGLARLLAGRCEIVGTIADGNLVADAVSRLRPDVVLLDLSMPTVSGLEALEELRAKRLECRVIVLTMHGDARVAVEALRAGAAGFVLKESSGDELLTALDTVLKGRTYLTPALTRDVLAMMASPLDPERVPLTSRQREVLRLIVRGLRAKEIAALLGLSHRTVESIKYQMMQELNVHSTAELVRYALQHDVLVP